VRNPVSNIVLVAVTLVLLGASTAFPQASITGVIEGRLTDLHGNVVLAAQVKLSDPARGPVAPAQSPARRVAFALPGFRRAPSS
jgi:hypothetical protein